jgi:hypothetical protein
MQRTFGFVLFAAALSLTAGCRRHAPQPAPQAAAEQAPRLASTVHMGDPKSAVQLLSGFYGIEAKAWRWTGGQFIVELGTPYGAAQKGAALEFKLAVPAAVIEKSKSVTLAASADGQPLSPETYTIPGQYIYSRSLPPTALARDSVKVTFTVDKTIAAGGGDMRDLGVVATSIGLK